MSNRLMMSRFGQMGRAGNQFFEYIFLTGYAEKYGATLEVPPWVGQYLYGAKDPPLGPQLPDYTEVGGGLNQPTPPVGDEIINHDFIGFCQYRTDCHANDKDRIRKLFTPIPEIADRFVKPKEQLYNLGQTRIGLHLRGGDFGRNIFPLVPDIWYLNWLEENWGRFDNPVLFLSAEDRKFEVYQKYNPVIPESLGVTLNNVPMNFYAYDPQDWRAREIQQFDWYPDFYLLQQCDVVLGPSSTFSLAAAMLNPTLLEYWRAPMKDERFVQTDPWHTYPILREHCKDFPHLKGLVTCTDHNPYWTGGR